MKILHLPLKKKWYEMIESGIKTEEYREIKPYWSKRFFKNFPVTWRMALNIGMISKNYAHLYGKEFYPEHTHIKFSYGYTKRTMTFELEKITIGKGKPEWGAPNEDVFIIHLGKRIKELEEEQ